MDSYLDIYRDGEIVNTIMPKSDACLHTGIGDFASITLEWVSTKSQDIRIGDYVIVRGIRLYCYALPKKTMENSGKYEYSAKLYGEEYMLKNSLFLFLDYKEGKVIQSSSEFSLTATAGEFMSLIVRNINRNVVSEWSYNVTDLTKANETVTMDITRATCKDMIDRVCDEFDAEWKFDYEAKCITISDKEKIERKTGIKLSYPTNLSSPIELKHKEYVISRLYVYGGTRNLPKGYNDFEGRLLMTGGLTYLELDRAIHCESVLVLDDIYPRRNSTINGVRKSGDFFFVMDSTMDFNINEMLQEGQTAKIAFNSGRLAGYTFEIASYKATTKEIEIKQQTDADIVIPNDTLRPEIGDKYVLLDIVMPKSYVENAEKELRDEAVKYFKENCVDKVKADVVLSPTWLSRNEMQFSIFDKVIIDVDGEERDIRITEVKQYPFRKSTYGTATEITISEYVDNGAIANIREDLSAVGRRMHNDEHTRQSFENTITRNINSVSDQLTWL